MENAGPGTGWNLARYADSDGYEKDSKRPHAWRWRTWVINAFNAGHALRSVLDCSRWQVTCYPIPIRAELVATGFHRNTLINREGGTDPEEDRVKRTVDRTNTMGSIWLGHHR